jgi:alpha-ketoglutarate-dependent taurine dioxygenase
MAPEEPSRNRCTMHIALADFAGHRRMHRVSVLGARPEAA